MNTGAIFVVGAIIAGVAVGGALFLFFPDLMFGSSSFSSQSDGGSASSVGVGGAEDTTTASIESDFPADNSTSNSTSGAP